VFQFEQGRGIKRDRVESQFGKSEKMGVKKSTKQIKASCYLRNKNYEGEVPEFSVIWGIIENLENGKCAVKFIIEIEDKRIVIWISDFISLESMLKMLEDILRMKSEKEIEEIADELVRDVNEILAKFREKGGQIFEAVVRELCESWGMDDKQTKKVIALSIAIAKTLEEMFIKRGELIPYIG